MHAQNDEDDYYDKYIDVNKSNGRYVDIGAGDPECISNTQMLYNKGWLGLCVEPQEMYAPKWSRIRPRDILVTSPIMDVEKDFEMRETCIEGSFLYDIYKNDNRKLVMRHAITFKQLMDRYPEFLEPDLFTLDVEVSEDKVLATADFSIFKPKLIIIEKCVRGIDNKPKWEHLLLPFYDSVQEFAGNTFYLRK